MVLNLRDSAALSRHRDYVPIDRRTRWGNPYHIGKDGTREEVIAKYRTWLWEQIKLGRIRINDLAALAGRPLACHCAPLECHGNVLARAAQWAAQMKREADRNSGVGDDAVQRETRPHHGRETEQNSDGKTR